MILDFGLGFIVGLVAMGIALTVFGIFAAAASEQDPVKWVIDNPDLLEDKELIDLYYDIQTELQKRKKGEEIRDD